MASKHDTEFDPTRPGLVLLFGNTSKKHRMLDRDAILIGRARGCDLGLEAPDVSSIHCVITRGPKGFQLRDCQSRAGTKYNGNLVREALLRDGDLLQIGPFSFRVHLPAGCVVAPAAGTPRLKHLDRSRRNLARMALRQRKLLRLERAIKQDSGGKAVEEQLTKQASALKARIRDYDKRVRVLEDTERDLFSDRENFDREMADFRARVEQTDRDLAVTRELLNRELADFRARVEESERDLAGDRETFDREMAGLRAKAAQTDQELAARREMLDRETADYRIRIEQTERAFANDREKADLRSRTEQSDGDLATTREALDREIADFHAKVEQTEREFANDREILDRQLAEMRTNASQTDRSVVAAREALNREIADFRASVEQIERELANDREQFNHEIADFQVTVERNQKALGLQNQFSEQRQKEFAMTRDQWARDQAVILARLADQKASLALVEETLREQRQGLDDVLATLQEGYDEADTTADGDLEKLLADNAQLRKLLAETLEGREPAAEDLLLLQAENEELKRLLAANDHTADRNGTGAASETHADSSEEVVLLRKLLDEKDALLEEWRSQTVQVPAVERDIDSYEAELNQFRRQLESDRDKLNREIEQLRARNKELDEATREMELEMSRERADLARERQRLDRVREDVRLELERLQRDAGLRDRLAPMQNLRDEINHRRHPSADQTPRPVQEDALTARLKSLRNKVNGE